MFCVAVVEPAERDLGRKLIRDCPAQEALQDFLHSEGGNGGNGANSSNESVSTNCRSPSGFYIGAYQTLLFFRFVPVSIFITSIFSVSKLGDLVAQELHQREVDPGSGRLSQTSPPSSPKIKLPQAEVAPASNESGYKSSPNPSDPGKLETCQSFIPIVNLVRSDNLSFSIPNVDSICQENELIRQGVQQLQNKINQFQRRDGLGGSPLLGITHKSEYPENKLFWNI